MAKYGVKRYLFKRWVVCCCCCFCWFFSLVQTNGCEKYKCACWCCAVYCICEGPKSYWTRYTQHMYRVGFVNAFCLTYLFVDTYCCVWSLSIRCLQDATLSPLFTCCPWIFAFKWQPNSETESWILNLFTLSLENFFISISKMTE